MERDICIIVGRLIRAALLVYTILYVLAHRYADAGCTLFLIGLLSSNLPARK